MRIMVPMTNGIVALFFLLIATLRSAAIQAWCCRVTLATRAVQRDRAALDRLLSF